MSTVKYPMGVGSGEYLEGIVEAARSRSDVRALFGALHHVLGGGAVTVDVVREGDAAAVAELDAKLSKGLAVTNEVNGEMRAYASIIILHRYRRVSDCRAVTLGRPMQNAAMRTWVVVGAGFAGVHFAVRWLDRGHGPSSIALVDRHATPLARWNEVSASVEVPFLRSPVVHHLAPAPRALRDFAVAHFPNATFLPPYNQPPYSVFQAHCQRVLDDFGVARLVERGTVTRIDLLADRVAVHGSEGTVWEAERAVLAIGSMERPAWPQWAEALRGNQAIAHVFDHGRRLDPAGSGHEIVVGGGLSAVQRALASARFREVTILSRHVARVSLFDFDAGWLGPKELAGFHAEADPEVRRARVAGARRRGSLPIDAARDLRRAIAEERVRFVQGEVERAEITTDGFRLVLHGGATLTCARISLATGFEPGRPGGRMVDDLATRYRLATTRDGTPIIDERLRWHPRLFVTGQLAEMEIGPAARNIAGARMCAERIVGGLC